MVYNCHGTTGNTSGCYLCWEYNGLQQLCGQFYSFVHHLVLGLSLATSYHWAPEYQVRTISDEGHPWVLGKWDCLCIYYSVGYHILLSCVAADERDFDELRQ